MIVNGQTTVRDDGSEVVLGYGLDADGNVTGRFAIPDSHHWECPDATESFEVVDAMDKLPAVDSQYLDG